MKKITISLDDKTAAWARGYAAKQGKSLSRLLGEILRERTPDAVAYDRARRRFLAFKTYKFDWIDGRKPDREELY